MRSLFFPTLLAGLVLIFFAFSLAGFIPSAAQETSPPTAQTAPVEIYEEMVDVPYVPRDDAAAGISGKFLKTGDVNLYVQDIGEGPPVVLLNGGPGNALHAFHPEFTRAADFSRVIFYDRRGQGLSDWAPGEGYTVAQALEDLENLRKELGIERWVVLGHSWGGFFALAYAQKYPEHTGGIVLVDALTQMAGPDACDNRYVYEFMTPEEVSWTREIYTSGGKIVASHSDDVDLASLQKNLFNAYRNGDWRRQYYYKPTIKKMAQIALYEWVHDKNYNTNVARDTQNYDLTGAFRETDIPVLVVEGKWSPLWGLRACKRLEALKTEFPNGKILVFEKSSHNPHQSEPGWFFSELKEFIEIIQVKENQ